MRRGGEPHTAAALAYRPSQKTAVHSACFPVADGSALACKSLAPLRTKSIHTSSLTHWPTSLNRVLTACYYQISIPSRSCVCARIAVREHIPAMRFAHN